MGILTMDEAWHAWTRREDAATTLYLALATEPDVLWLKTCPALLPSSIPDLTVLVGVRPDRVWFVPIDEVLISDAVTLRRRYRTHRVQQLVEAGSIDA